MCLVLNLRAAQLGLRRQYNQGKLSSHWPAVVDITHETHENLQKMSNTKYTRRQILQSSRCGEAPAGSGPQTGELLLYNVLLFNLVQQTWFGFALRSISWCSKLAQNREGHSLSYRTKRTIIVMLILNIQTFSVVLRDILSLWPFPHTGKLYIIGMSLVSYRTQ